MKKLVSIIFIISMIGFVACENDESDLSNESGILKGTTGIFEGNCMPSPNVPPCEPSPVSTTVAITQLSAQYDVDLLIDSVVTSESGTFEIELPEGEYSIFLRDGDEFICDYSSGDDDSFCVPIFIKSDSTTTITANIDHASW